MKHEKISGIFVNLLVGAYFSYHSGIFRNRFFRAAINFYLVKGWQAQVNFDFQIYLILAAVWVFYREKNFLRGIIFAILELLLGNLFFAPYLAHIIYRAKGDAAKILLGKEA